jgi:hypothetical protein
VGARIVRAKNRGRQRNREARRKRNIIIINPRDYNNNKTVGARIVRAIIIIKAPHESSRAEPHKARAKPSSKI